MGPIEPIAGSMSAVMSMVGDMTEGFMDVPKEIHRAVDTNSNSDNPRPPRMPEERNTAADEVAPLLIHEYYAPEQPRNFEELAASESRKASRSQATKRILQGTCGATIGTSKGIGRIIMAGIKSPFQVSLEVARGFHNVPKLYGDPTVRETFRITGFASGMEAAGRASLLLQSFIVC